MPCLGEEKNNKKYLSNKGVFNEYTYLSWSDLSTHPALPLTG